MLWLGFNLDRLRQFISQTDDDLTEIQRQFFQECLKSEFALLQKKNAIEAARRRITRVAWVVAGAMGLLGTVALWNWADAREQAKAAKVNEARSIALLIASKIASPPDEHTRSEGLIALATGRNLLRSAPLQDYDLTVYRDLLFQLYQGVIWFKGLPAVVDAKGGNVTNLPGTIRYSESEATLTVPTYSRVPLLVDRATGNLQGKFIALDKVTHSMDLDKDNQLILMRSFDHAYVVDAKSAKSRGDVCVQKIDQDVVKNVGECQVVATLFTPDGNRIVSVGEDTSFNVYNSKTGKPEGMFMLPAISGTKEHILDFAFDRNGRDAVALVGKGDRFHTGSEENNNLPLKLYYIHIDDNWAAPKITYMQLDQYVGNKDAEIASYDNGEATISANNSIAYYRFMERIAEKTVTGGHVAGNMLEDGKSELAWTDGEKYVDLLDSHGSVTKHLDVAGCGMTGLLAVVRPSYLLLYRRSGDVCIVSRGSSSISHLWKNPSGQIRHLFISTDDQQIVIVGYDDKIALWPSYFVLGGVPVRDRPAGTETATFSADKDAHGLFKVEVSPRHFVRLKLSDAEHVDVIVDFRHKIVRGWSTGQRLNGASDGDVSVGGYLFAAHYTESSLSAPVIEPQAVQRFTNGEMIHFTSDSANVLVNDQKGCLVVWREQGTNWEPGTCLDGTEQMEKVLPLRHGGLVAGRDLKGYLWIWDPSKSARPMRYDRKIADSSVDFLPVATASPFESWDLLDATEDGAFLAVGDPSGSVRLIRAGDGSSVSGIDMNLQCEHYEGTAPLRGEQICLRQVILDGDAVRLLRDMSPGFDGSLVYSRDQDWYDWRPDPDVWRSDTSDILAYLGLLERVIPREVEVNLDEWCSDKAVKAILNSDAYEGNAREIFMLRAFRRYQASRENSDSALAKCPKSIQDVFPLGVSEELGKPDVSSGDKSSALEGLQPIEDINGKNFTRKNIPGFVDFVQGMRLYMGATEFGRAWELLDRSAQAGFIPSETATLTLSNDSFRDPVDLCKLEQLASKGEPVAMIVLSQLLFGVDDIVQSFVYPYPSAAETIDFTTHHRSDLLFSVQLANYVLKTLDGFDSDPLIKELRSNSLNIIRITSPRHSKELFEVPLPRENLCSASG